MRPCLIGEGSGFRAVELGSPPARRWIVRHGRRLDGDGPQTVQGESVDLGPGQRPRRWRDGRVRLRVDHQLGAFGRDEVAYGCARPRCGSGQGPQAPRTSIGVLPVDRARAHPGIIAYSAGRQEGSPRR